MHLPQVAMQMTAFVENRPRRSLLTDLQRATSNCLVWDLNIYTVQTDERKRLRLAAITPRHRYYYYSPISISFLFLRDLN